MVNLRISPVQCKLVITISIVLLILNVLGRAQRTNDLLGVKGVFKNDVLLSYSEYSDSLNLFETRFRNGDMSSLDFAKKLT